MKYCLLCDYITLPCLAEENTPSDGDACGAAASGVVRLPEVASSFAPVRRDGTCAPLLSGKDYFASAAHAILGAEHQILLAGWWIDLDLPLVRGLKLGTTDRPLDRSIEAEAHESAVSSICDESAIKGHGSKSVPGASANGAPDVLTLRHLLQRKAEQGVQIFVLVYWEIAGVGLANNSTGTMEALRGMHPNIRAQRHPDHERPGGLGMRALCVHHEKLLVIDDRVAFVGGLDPAPGRFCHSKRDLCDPAGVGWRGADYINDMGMGGFLRWNAQQQRQQLEWEELRAKRGLVPAMSGTRTATGSSAASIAELAALQTRGSDVHEAEASLASASRGSSIPRVGSISVVSASDRQAHAPFGPSPLSAGSRGSAVGGQRQEATEARAAASTGGVDETGAVTEDDVQLETALENQASQSSSWFGCCLPAPTKKQPESHRQTKAAGAEKAESATSPVEASEKAGGLACGTSASGSGSRQQHEPWREPSLGAREVVPRMPWHDVQLALRGEAVKDVSKHFVERWAHHAKEALEAEHVTEKPDGAMPVVDISAGVSTGAHEGAISIDVLKAAVSESCPAAYLQLVGDGDAAASGADDVASGGASPHSDAAAVSRTACSLQVVRQAGPWSNGLSTPDTGIASAYCSLIQ